MTNLVEDFYFDDFLNDSNFDGFDWDTEKTSDVADSPVYGLQTKAECKEFFYSIAPKYFKGFRAFSSIDSLEEVGFSDMKTLADVLLTEILDSSETRYFMPSSCKQSTAVEKVFNSETMGRCLNILRNKILNVEG